jgi:formate hydrogenlyase subunit 6/NADH:ubiquinone oxidoreductase subunit I
VDQAKCIGCGMCEARCPKKAITMVASAGLTAGKPSEKEMAAV